MALTLRPITLKTAKKFVGREHRHHAPPVGHKFSIGVEDDEGELVGVVVTGRPVARHCDDGWTAEVTRLATDGTYNACSILYAAAARAARAMGYKKIQTYILAEEPGTSLKAAGWKCELEKAGGGDWTSKSKPNRRQDQPQQMKQRWAKVLND